MLTEREVIVLQAIMDCEYHDATPRAERVGNPVWTWACNPFAAPSRRAFAGVVSSLVKKGLAVTGEYEPGNPEYNTLAITQKGYDALHK